MATITIQYDGRNTSAKRLLEFLRTLSFIKINEDANTEYDSEIVAKVKQGQKEYCEGKCTTIKASEIWN